MRRLIIFVLLFFTILAPGCSRGTPPAENKTAVSPASTPNPPAWVNYTNKNDGYQIEVPGAWTLDAGREGIVTRLTSDDHMAIIEIFAQPLNGISASDYLGYSNQHIVKQEQGVKLLAQNNQPVKKMKAYRLMWQRPQINGRSNDLYLYREISLLFPQTVYTFTLKTDPAHFEQYSPVLDHVTESFASCPSVNTLPDSPPAFTPKDIDLQGKTMHVHIPSDKLMFGIFNPAFHPYKYNPAQMPLFNKYEDSLGYHFDFIMTYFTFKQSYPQTLVDNSYAAGRMMMLTWQPVLIDGPSPANITIPNIINGDYDAYIRDWAQHLKVMGEPIFLRFANEMNGDWDPYCAWFFCKDTDLYIDAWRHIYNIFKAQGANNVLFVWNPHDRTYPNFKWNSPSCYYPGADYVDWVGLTCYNNGTSHSADKWRSFNQMYQPVYNDYLRQYPGKPFMITEFSCNEVGGDKKAWIKDCLASLPNYPNIRIATWYDQTDGKWLYRLDSTPGAKEAFRQGISSPYFLRNAITR
ncbi:MAG TPA: glycosyl hydrolase [Syntrophomonadaceae bacterium]|nr:glycosyl hydrolase [Syntrophomonadaceae bacterium]